MSGYISVVDWERFQHYKDRGPLWIKMYTALMSSDEYLELSFARRGMLQGMLLEYARSGCRLSAETASLSRKLAGRVTVRDLESLNHAGFIEIVASKTLANGYQPASASRARGEREKEKTSSQVGSVARSLDLDHDSKDSDKEDEPFASEPEPALPPLNGATADGYGLQPLIDRYKPLE